MQIQKREDGLLHQADVKRNEGQIPQSQRLPKVSSGYLRLGALAREMEYARHFCLNPGLGNSLAIQWLGLSSFTAGAGFNPWWGN